MFTMNNADNGLGSGSGGGVDTIKIDLTNYALKEDTATKVDLEALKTTVAGKIDKEPQHHHTIAEVDELQAELNAKYDTSKKYSYNVILSDSEKIPFLENTKIINLDITTSKETSGYVMKMDNSSGDFQVLKNNVAIMSYNSALNHWIISGNDLNNFMTNTNDVLKNHYDALVILGNNHSQTDTNPDDGDKITLSPSDGGTGGDTGGSTDGGDSGGSTGEDSGTTTTPTIYHKEYTFTEEEVKDIELFIPICSYDTEYFEGKLYILINGYGRLILNVVYSSIINELTDFYKLYSDVDDGSIINIPLYIMKCKISSTGEYKICLGLFSNQMTFENEEITYNSFEYKLLSPYKIDETTILNRGYTFERIITKTFTIDNETTTA